MQTNVVSRASNEADMNCEDTSKTIRSMGDSLGSPDGFCESAKDGHSFIVPIVFATNEAYAPYAGVCIRSIIDNAVDDVFYDVRVLHTGLSEETQHLLCSAADEALRVECIDVSDMIARFGDKLYERDYFSREMYYRFLIPDIMSEYERVIYLDCDMTVRCDLSMLMKIDMSRCCIAGCRNLMHQKMRDYVSDVLGLQPEKYINSGMMLFDTAACRKFRLLDRVYEEIGKWEMLRYPDQDLMNIIMSGRICYLPTEWNYLWHLERLEGSARSELRLLPSDRAALFAAKPNARIIHYTGDMKPWHYNGIPGADEFWKYAERSAFYEWITVRFAEKNRELEKVKLLFLDIRRDEYTVDITVAHEVLFDDRAARFAVYRDGKPLRTEACPHRNTVRGNVRLTQRIYRLSLPIDGIMSSPKRLTFLVNGSTVMFEYDKFFPLNGCSRSYFADCGILMYRDGRVLVLERCNKRKRIAHEVKYLKQLLTSHDRIRRKYFFVRLMYFITHIFMPKNIWLISDRPGVAGDNGEALFRYISADPKLSHRIRAYFVIDDDSPDYERLLRLGRVVRMSSFKHKLLALHADVKAVSQTDRPLYEPLERNYVKDLRHREVRVFLQHGITKDDISTLYSRYTHGFDIFVTAAHPEYDSIIENADYGCDEKIVKLTGFPRHDLLCDRAERIVLLAPTWRRELDPEHGGDEARFLSSEFYCRWHELIVDGTFMSECRKHGYSVELLLHNKVRPYAAHFDDVARDVRIVGEDERFADVFSRAAVLVTDYSSNSFEFSYLGKPVVYYQFDSDEFFRLHTYNKGYFDYERDGFGAVAHTEVELVGAVGEILDRGGCIDEKYASRIASFFAHRDGGSCERVVAEILGRLAQR